MARVWFVPPQETETDRKYHPRLARVLRSGEGEIEIGNRVSSTFFLFGDDDGNGGTPMPVHDGYSTDGTGVSIRHCLGNRHEVDRVGGDSPSVGGLLHDDCMTPDLARALTRP